MNISNQVLYIQEHWLMNLWYIIVHSYELQMVLNETKYQMFEQVESLLVMHSLFCIEKNTILEHIRSIVLVGIQIFQILRQICLSASWQINT